MMSMTTNLLPDKASLFNDWKLLCWRTFVQELVRMGNNCGSPAAESFGSVSVCIHLSPCRLQQQLSLIVFERNKYSTASYSEFSNRIRKDNFIRIRNFEYSHARIN